MASHRLQRVRELLKQAIGEAIRREIPINQAGIITVNDVELGGDLQNATVFLSFLGSSEQQRTGLALLRRNRARIKSMVAKAVVLKYMPRLRFQVDDTVERGNRVLAIIDELEKLEPASTET